MFNRQSMGSIITRDYIIMELTIHVHTLFRDYMGIYLKGKIKQNTNVILLVKKNPQ